MDLVLGPFADAHVGTMETAELDRLEMLMDEHDTDLLNWVIGREAPPPRVDGALLARLVEFRKSGPH